MNPRKAKKISVVVRDVGRPTKLTRNFIEVARDVLDDEDNVIIFTDEELRDEINSKLEETERITDSRWEAWKKGAIKDPIVNEFRVLIKDALRIQKRNLYSALKTMSAGEWQKMAWILERKFREWNIRNITEISGPEGKALDINITKTLLGDSIKFNEEDAKAG